MLVLLLSACCFGYSDTDYDMSVIHFPSVAVLNLWI